MLDKVEAQRFLYKFLREEVTLIELEKWLYSNDELEVLLGETDYFEFVSRNYKNKYAYQDTEKQIRRLIHIGFFEQERIVHSLVKLTQCSDEYLSIIATLYDDYCNGYNFLRFIALTYITTSDEYKEILNHDPNKFREYCQPINAEANRLLEFFQKNQLKIEHEKECIDKREESEKIEIYHVNEMMSNARKE
ncbi:hypothetical protein [Cohnella fermenti]|uniref:Uncharacterized protein n=1 Tax=Cohnella fermenti TaxID=2565925 RepID=A0A4S4BPR5_9BACL|nr:hypothetical protein [Cohnella fermenti]THF76893.1 hypothetical protein E6C55_17680 [Cohnella fermenti]